MCFNVRLRPWSTFPGCSIDRCRATIGDGECALVLHQCWSPPKKQKNHSSSISSSSSNISKSTYSNPSVQYLERYNRRYRYRYRYRHYLLSRQTASLTSQNPIHCASPDTPCMVPCLAAAMCPYDPAPCPTITLVETPHSEMASRISLLPSDHINTRHKLPVISLGGDLLRVWRGGLGFAFRGDRRMGH